jgi:basic membrane lipoprotein Med (substrate-binding protein (PBP1-ABC) superfamily)
MKNKRMSLILLMVALLVTSIVPALHVAAQDSVVNKLCLVTDLGRVNDGTFNQFAHEGAKKAADEFGLDYTFIETQAQTDYAKNIQTCLDEGYDTIVTVGFLIAEATGAAAKDNPDVHFIGVDQYVGPDADGNAAPANYAGLQFREDQAGFLAGALAAQMTKSGTIAGVYGIDIPPVKKYRNGFEQGAAFIDPKVKVLGTYIPSFVDPAAGGTAAAQFLGEGADVIFGAGGPTGSGGIIEAAKKGALVIGVDQDEYTSTFGNGSADGAKNIISSAMKLVDQAVYLAVKSLVDGGADFPGGSNLIMSAQNDGVGFAPKHDSDVPDDVTAKMDTILAGLKDGSVWTGVDPVGGDLLPTMSDAAAAAGLTKLAAAIEAAGLTSTADTSTTPLTVFAPNDDAFAAVDAATLDSLMKDPTALTGVLLYHVVSGAHLSSDIVGMGSMDVPTLAGTSLTVAVADDGSITVNGAKVVQADILTRTGVIHVIDTVLMPPAAK